MKFTYELESNNTLPFLNILLIRNINKLEFKVYHKPTSNNDHIHFYSHHNNNTKRGVVIDFYLRALRICTFITLPNNSTNIIINNLNKLDIKTASLPFKTICDLVHSSPQCNIVSDASVYWISCSNCKLKYIGKTSRNFQACLKEHKRDIRVGNLKNALLQHISQSNHNFNFNSAKIFIYILDKDKFSRLVLFHFVIPETLFRVFTIFFCTWANLF